MPLTPWKRQCSIATWAILFALPLAMAAGAAPAQVSPLPPPPMFMQPPEGATPEPPELLRRPVPQSYPLQHPWVEWAQMLHLFNQATPHTTPNDVLGLRPRGERRDLDWEWQPVPPSVNVSTWTPACEMTETYHFMEGNEEYQGCEVFLLSRSRFLVQCFAYLVLNDILPRVTCTGAWIHRKPGIPGDLIIDMRDAAGALTFMLHIDDSRAKGPVTGALPCLAALVRVSGEETMEHPPGHLKGMVPLEDPAAALREWGIHVEIACP